MPTNNPVPSRDPSDLPFNAEKLDQFVNGTAQSFVDRKGTARPTIAGFQSNMTGLVAQVASARAGATSSIAADVGTVESARQAAVLEIPNKVASLAAFNDRGAWSASTVYAVKDLAKVADEWYVAIVPHTSAASFATDKAARWRLYQGVTTGDLLAPDGADKLSYQDPATGAQLQSMRRKQGQKLNVMDFIDPSMWTLIESGNPTGQNAALVGAGIRSAVAAALSRRRRLDVAGGVYVHDAVTVDGPLEIAGEGRGATKFVGPLNATAWTINSTSACGFRDMILSGRNESTSGDVIQLNGSTEGAVNYYSELLNITIMECWNGFHPKNAGGFALRDSYLVNCFGTAALIENQANGDNGDSSISGCILANSNGVGYGIRHLSSGGLRVLNNKSLGFKKAYWMRPGSGVTTTIFIASGNSFEGFTEHGYLFDTNGGTYGNIQVGDNQISVFGSGCKGIEHNSHQNFIYTDNVIRAGSSNEIGIDIVSGGPGLVGANVMQANSGNSGTGVRVQASADNVTIAPHRFQGWGTNVINNSATSTDFSSLGSMARQASNDVTISGGTATLRAVRAKSTAAKTGAQSDVLTVGSSDVTNALELLVGFAAGYTRVQSIEQNVGFRPFAINPGGGNVLVGKAVDTAGGGALQVNGGISAVLPTSASGLPSGALWRNGNVVNVVS